MLTVLHVEQIKQFVLAGRRPTVVSPCLFSHAQSLFPPDVCVRYVFLSSWTVPVQGFRLLGLERAPQGPGEALRGPEGPTALPPRPVCVPQHPWGSSRRRAGHLCPPFTVCSRWRLTGESRPAPLLRHPGSLDGSALAALSLIKQ